VQGLVQGLIGCEETRSCGLSCSWSSCVGDNKGASLGVWWRCWEVEEFWVFLGLMGFGGREG
jgi:hypothetical protein